MKVAVGALLPGVFGKAVEPMAVECIAETAYKIRLSVGANLINTHVPVSFCRGVGSRRRTAS